MSEERLDRLEAAFDAYCEWVSGGPGDREEFLAKHEELRDLLEPMLEEPAVGSAVGSAADAAVGSAVDDRPGRVIGDFRLIRELGRGGMGVVYLADQLSLRREVALKLLPPAFLVGAHSVARFRREAEIMGRLDHPGLVKVFAVGQVEDTFYYAMERIDGCSLQVAIDQLTARSSSPCSGEDFHAALGFGDPPGTFWRRPLVEVTVDLIEQVAIALEHAHRAGVVHRDVKPANILVRTDGTAALTDFGLARQDDLPTLTRAGAFAGTPRYTSPEQIRGERVDARADVFSLGATLYELITHRAPFPGESTQQVLDRVRLADPADPHRVNPLVGPDLAAVTLKALEKEPSRRYQSAGELAEDLRAVLEHRPVRARRVSAAARGVRWTRRNPAWASTLALALVLVVGGPLTFGLYQQSARRESQRLEQSAQRSLGRAFEAIDQMLTRVADVRLVDVPQAGPVRRALLEDALDLYRSLLEQEGDAPEVRRRTAAAHGRMASLLEDLGRFAEARAAVARALAMQEQLCREFPDNLDDRLALASSHHVDGLIHAKRDPAAAVAAAERAVTLVDTILIARPRDPDALDLLVQTCGQLGNWHSFAGNLEAAESHLRRALSLAREHATAGDDPVAVRTLAEAHTDLGRIQHMRGQLDDAIASNREAMVRLRRLAQSYPTWRAGRTSLGTVLNNLGSMLLDADEPAEAEQILLEGEAASRALIADFPDAASFRSTAASICLNLSNLMEQTGRSDAAIRYARQASSHQEALAAEHPDDAQFARTLSVSLNQTADSMVAAERWDDARDLLVESVAAARRGCELEPQSASSQSRLGGALNNLALHDYQQGTRLAGLPGLVEEAVACQRRALAKEPENATYRDYLRNHYGLLHDVQLQLGNHAGAADAAEGLGDVYVDDGDHQRMAGQFLASCVALALEDDALGQAARDRAAARYATRALARLERARELGAISAAELASEDAYAPLRSGAGFAALLQRAKKDR